MENKLVSGKQAISYRNYRRARDRALNRLSKAYPDDYKELLEQEKASDKEQGKNWVALDGNTHFTVGVNTNAGGKTSSLGVSGHSNSGESEGD